jgi:cell division septation protein DedD
MAHHVSASYDAEEHLFLPPSRTLGFNAQLRMNDSLLVHSYMTAYDMSYPEALRRIESEVAELKEQLHSGGSYELQDLGTLTVNDEGNYEFAPSEAGILSPAYYGLDALSVRKRHDTADTLIQLADDDSQPVVAASEEPAATPATEEKSAAKLIEFGDDDDRAINIRLSWIRNTAAVAAAALVLLIISTPIINGNFESLKMSNLNHQLLYKLLPQDTNMAKAVPMTKPAAKVVEKKEAPAKEATPAADVAAKATPAADVAVKATPAAEPAATTIAEAKQTAVSYTIVVASQVKRSNAEIYVEKLHKMGYEDATIYVHEGVVRVVMGDYASPADAYRRLNRLSAVDGFEDAWVYKKSV